jgi:hypothetical protein
LFNGIIELILSSLFVEFRFIRLSSFGYCVPYSVLSSVYRVPIYSFIEFCLLSSIFRIIECLSSSELFVYRVCLSSSGFCIIECLSSSALCVY